MTVPAPRPPLTPAPPASEPEGPLKERTVNAAKWSYLSFGIIAAIQPLFAAILARLVTPGQFGAVAIGMLLYALGQYLNDLGVSQALVQKRELTRDDVRAGFTSSIVLGLFTTLLGWFSAPLAGHFFHNPEVVPVFRGFACTYLLVTLAIVPNSLLRRELRFKPLMWVELSSYLLGHGLFGLGSAWLGFGAMSLVISVLAQNIVSLAGLFILKPPSFGVTLRWESFRGLYAFGSRVSLVSLMEFASQSLDTFLIGRLYSAASLGLYNRAYNITLNPMLLLARSTSRVMAPSFSKVQTEPERLRRAYLSGIQALSVVIFPVALGILVCAHELVLVLLGERFAGSIPVVQVLALLIPFPVLTNLAAVMAEATARLNVKIGIQAAYLAFTISAFLLVHSLGYGVITFALVLLCAGILRCLAYTVVAGGIIGGSALDSLRVYAVGAAWGLVVATPLYLVVSLMRSLHLALPLIFGAELLVGGGMLLAVIMFGPPNELRTLIQTLLRRRPFSGKQAQRQP